MLLDIALISSIFPSKSKPYVGTFVFEHARWLMSQNWINKIYLIHPYSIKKYPMEISKLLKLKNIDLIDAQFAIPAGLFVNLRKSTPMVLTTHRWEVIDYNNILYYFFLKKSFSRANRIISVSHFIEAKIHAIDPRTVKKTEVLHNCVDVKKIQSFREPLSRIKDILKKSEKNGSLRIVTIAHLTKRKGIDLVIRGIAQLIPEVKIDYFIIGTGPEMPFLRDLIRKMKVSNKVHLLDYMVGPELYSFINNTDIFVLMSISEGHSVAVLEAKTAGNVIILGNYPGAHEAIEHDVEGFIIPHDVSELRTIITRLWEEPALIEKIRKNNLKYAKKHDFENRSLKLKQIYLEVAES